MIRGINRQVIEVNRTGSVYFERALLVVNPVFYDTGKAVLEREAKEVMERLGEPPAAAEAAEKKIHRVKRWAGFLAAGGLGALAATLILLLF